MAEWISQQSAGSLIALVSVTGGLLIGLVCIVGGLWSNARQTEYLERKAEWEVALKRDMVARGMSAEEIERVMNASTAPATADAAEQTQGAKSCFT